MKKNCRKGFTVPELMIALSIIAVVFGFITVNLIGSERKTSLTGAVNTIISDIKSQQIKAMVGSTEGRASADAYGVYFEPTQYTLFHGTTYQAGLSSNFTIHLDQNLQFTSTTIPNATLVFTQGSGSVSAFVAGQNTITIKNTAGTENKTFTINRYGAITAVQ